MTQADHRHAGAVRVEPPPQSSRRFVRLDHALCVHLRRCLAGEEPQAARQFLHHARDRRPGPARIVPARAGRVNPLRLDTQLLQLLAENLHAHVRVALEMLHGTEALLLVVGDDPDASGLRCFDETDAAVMAAGADAEDVNGLAAFELLPHRGDALLRVGTSRRMQPHQRSGESRQRIRHRKRGRAETLETRADAGGTGGHRKCSGSHPIRDRGIHDGPFGTTNQSLSALHL